jgi:hypothetical protein
MLRVLVIALAALALVAPPAGACCIRVHVGPRSVEKAVPPPLAIGDSVMIAAARRLAHAGFEVDAREGRFMRHALQILHTRKRKGARPKVVVVAIGTNYPATFVQIRRALALLGPHRTLALVTPKRSWRGIGGPAIRRAARHWPHRVKVLDWVGYSAPHPGWFWSDGTHLRPSGARGFTRLLRTALP